MRLEALATLLTVLLLVFPLTRAVATAPDKEYMTAKEIEKIQDAQELEKRIKLYLEFSDLRLKSAQERLSGKESEAGDPMEFFSVEDMLDSYYRMLRSVMLILDNAYQRPATDHSTLGKALKNLKSSTEKAARSLELLKRIAEEKKLESVWNLVNKAIDLTNGAHDGAELGLSRQPATSKGKPKYLGPQLR